MANKYNPLQTIILFEDILKITDPYRNDLKNYIMEYIDIINRHNTNEEINSYIDTHPLNGNNNTVNDKDIKVAITNVMPKLKKICNTENMMDHFMYALYSIENK